MQLLPFDRECAAIAARLRAELEASGTPIGPHDTLMSATFDLERKLNRRALLRYILYLLIGRSYEFIYG